MVPICNICLELYRKPRFRGTKRQYRSFPLRKDRFDVPRLKQREFYYRYLSCLLSSSLFLDGVAGKPAACSVARQAARDRLFFFPKNPSLRIVVAFNHGLNSRVRRKRRDDASSPIRIPFPPRAFFNFNFHLSEIRSSVTAPRRSFISCSSPCLKRTLSKNPSPSESTHS